MNPPHVWDLFPAATRPNYSAEDWAVYDALYRAHGPWVAGPDRYESAAWARLVKAYRAGRHPFHGAVK